MNVMAKIFLLCIPQLAWTMDLSDISHRRTASNSVTLQSTIDGSSVLIPPTDARRMKTLFGFAAYIT